MLFSEVLGSMNRVGDVSTANVSADWLQGRSLFGGLQAALALRAMRDVVPALPLRVIQTTFVAPVLAGEVKIHCRVLRTGKSTVHVEARILDGEGTSVLVVGIFGKSRPSEIAVVPRQRATEQRSSPPAPLVPRANLPSFLQHFTMRWLEGGPPGGGLAMPEAIVEVSLHDAARATEAHVLGIADAIPPIALSMLRAHAFGSSLTWTLEMIREDRFEELPLAGWRLDVDLVAGGGGYTSQSEIVWGPGGEAVAVSRQCMVVFG